MNDASPLRRHLMRGLQIAASIAMLAILWHAVDGREALRILRSANVAWLCAALLALSAQTLLSALRWQVTAAQLGQKFAAGRAIGEYYLSQFVNQSLPGGMLGDAGRAIRARHQAGLVRAGQAVVLERVGGQAVVFSVMATTFLVTGFAPGGLVWPRWIQWPVALLILAGLMVPILLWGLAAVPGPQRRVIADFRDAVVAGLLRPVVLPKQIALSVATTACNLAAFAFCARATGVVLPMGAVLGLVPLILFTMLIPLTISGWGFREGAAAMLFPIAGATGAEGLAASVAFGLTFIVAVLPGVVPLLRRQRGGSLKT